jgi:type VI secretion system secreted protein Hcp
MAQTVHLILQIDGNDVEGESTIASLERENTIECSSFHYAVKVDYDPGSLRPIEKRQHEPVIIYKRIDKSTPLLLKALCRQDTVNSAEFRFYRPAISGAGAEEHYFTVLLENGFICSVEQVSEDAIMGGQGAPPMMEEVAFNFRDITWTYEDGGATHKDSIR